MWDCVPVLFRLDEVLGRKIGDRGVEVVADHSGTRILTSRVPGQAGGMLKERRCLSRLTASSMR